jgi:hypothetical protein
MAKENKGQFKPGQSGNPGGRVKLPDDIKEARKLNVVEFERAMNKCLYLTPANLELLLSAEETPVIEHLIGAVIKRGIKDGSHAHLDFVLNRLVGKVKDQLEVDGLAPFVIHKADGSQVLLGAKKKDSE